MIDHAIAVELDLVQPMGARRPADQQEKAGKAG
jgi:hypothetical protein